MRKIYLSCTLILAALLFLSTPASAEDSTDAFIRELQVHQTRAALHFGLDPKTFDNAYPHATCYYDDLVDHYEHDQLMRDEIDRGL